MENREKPKRKRKPRKPRKKKFTDKIPPNAKKILRAKKVKLAKKKRIKDYEEQIDKYRIEDWECPKLLHCYEGYDLLEHLYFARHFITKKYGHTTRFIEMLLFLYPKKYFTINDYFPLSHISYTWRFPKYMVNKGYVKVVSYPKIERISQQHLDPRFVYTLSEKGKKIVEEFYGILFGEIKYPELEEENIFAQSDKAIDQQRFKLVKKLNKLPVSENKRKYFEPKKGKG